MRLKLDLGRLGGARRGRSATVPLFGGVAPALVGEATGLLSRLRTRARSATAPHLVDRQAAYRAAVPILQGKGGDVGLSGAAQAGTSGRTVRGPTSGRALGRAPSRPF